ncbi:FKBP-type peptidyl-prolyl cis-trans isomerase [Paraglaciecola sp. 2405UD69-4]|uniref:FKBP-type peptidyl-prolyl cis-trans isomerase n=1 Tax=Paraglaciecola sp. 2405UD69-4 TaxID=3391836 RepID=UPI0039C98457
MKIAKGSVVQFLYKIKDTDGKELESNFDQEPIAYLHGYNNMMVGVEKSLESMEKGDEIEVELEAAETYGELQANSEQRVPIKHLVSSDKKVKWKAGMTAVVNTEQGHREVTILKAGKFMVTIDTNHPFAGKTLLFELKVVDVRAATDEEIEHGHAHGVGGHHH